MPNHAAPKQRRSRAQERFDRIYNEIRDRICLLDYQPGERLSEDELAEDFDVSRTPIRSVLNRLEVEGLVQSRHGVGTFVTDVDFKSLEEVFKFRMALAEQIGLLDPRPRTRRDIERLRDCLRFCDTLVSAPDPKGFARLNLDVFHEISELIGNQPLREVTIRLHLLTTRIWLTTVPTEDLPDEIARFRGEISDLLTAMELGDYVSVGLLWRSHVSMSFFRLRRYEEQRRGNQPSDF